MKYGTRKIVKNIRTVYALFLLYTGKSFFHFLKNHSFLDFITENMIWLISVLIFWSVVETKGLNLTEKDEILIMDFAESHNTPHCIIVVEDAEELLPHKYSHYFKRFLHWKNIWY